MHKINFYLFYSPKGFQYSAMHSNSNNSLISKGLIF
jgi:hypothetical protein